MYLSVYVPQARALRFGKVVSRDGDYAVRVSCEFDEAQGAPLVSRYPSNAGSLQR